MCIILHISLQNIYLLSDEDYLGLMEANNDINSEQSSACSGKPHTRRATSKELKMLKK